MENQYRQRARNPNHCNSNTVVPSVDDGFAVVCTCTYFELETLVTSIYFYMRFLIVRLKLKALVSHQYPECHVLFGRISMEELAVRRGRFHAEAGFGLDTSIGIERMTSGCARASLWLSTWRALSSRIERISASRMFSSCADPVLLHTHRALESIVTENISVYLLFVASPLVTGKCLVNDRLFTRFWPLLSGWQSLCSTSMFPSMLMMRVHVMKSCLRKAFKI